MLTLSLHRLRAVLWPASTPCTSIITPSTCGEFDSPRASLMLMRTGIFYWCRDPLASQGGVECSATYNNVASFNNGYVQICKDFTSSYTDFRGVMGHIGITHCISLFWSHTFAVDFYSPGETFSFFIEFRTYDCNGILLYTASQTGTDFAALELTAGSVSCILHET